MSSFLTRLRLAAVPNHLELAEECEVVESDEAPLEVDDLSEILGKLREFQKADFLQIQSELSNVLNSDEQVWFSDIARKINRFDISQERVLVVTNGSIYNFAKDKYRSFKRKIMLGDIRALVFSTCSEEMVIQVKNDYDYRYSFTHRADFCEIVGRLYEKERNQSLSMYLYDLLQLKNYAVSKVEFSKLNPEMKSRVRRFLQSSLLLTSTLLLENRIY